MPHPHSWSLKGTHSWPMYLAVCQEKSFRLKAQMGETHQSVCERDNGPTGATSCGHVVMVAPVLYRTHLPL